MLGQILTSFLRIIPKLPKLPKQIKSQSTKATYTCPNCNQLQYTACKDLHTKSCIINK